MRPMPGMLGLVSSNSKVILLPFYILVSLRERLVSPSVYLCCV